MNGKPDETTRAAKLIGINETCLMVADVGRSERFYEDAPRLERMNTLTKSDAVEATPFSRCRGRSPAR
jgi:hypothetical protein